MSNESRTVELSNQELEKVSGGNGAWAHHPCKAEFAGTDVVMYDCIKRLSDGVWFQCTGYVNEESQTIWTFTREGSDEQLAFFADKDHYLILGFTR